MAKFDWYDLENIIDEFQSFLIDWYDEKELLQQIDDYNNAGLFLDDAWRQFAKRFQHDKIKPGNKLN